MKAERTTVDVLITVLETARDVATSRSFVHDVVNATVITQARLEVGDTRIAMINANRRRTAALREWLNSSEGIAAQNRKRSAELRKRAHKLRRLRGDLHWNAVYARQTIRLRCSCGRIGFSVCRPVEEVI